MSTDEVRAFGSRPLPNVISSLHLEGATGRLMVKNPAGTRELVFVDGELRATRSDHEEEKLGSWLVSRGALSEQMKKKALEAQEGGDAPPFGHLLVTRKVLDEPTLTKHIESLALVILERATAGRRLSCEFFDISDHHQLDTLPRVATAQLILMAARALPDVEQKRAALGSPDKMVTRSGVIDEIVQAFDLSLAEAVIIGKLHREHSLFELKAVVALHDREFVAATYGLWVAGIITLTRPGATLATPAKPKIAAPASPASPSTDHAAECVEVQRLASEGAKLNHYRLLGLAEQATYQQIFDAWDEYQKRFSPDRADKEPHLKGLKPQLRSITGLAEEAFEILSSPERRPRYDRMIRTAASGGTSTVSIEASEKANRAKTNADAVSRAEGMVRRGDLFSAVKVLNEAADLNPTPEILLELARLMLKNPQWTNRAMEKLRRAVEIDPGFVDGWLEVSDFWRRRKSRERCRKSLERALSADPEHSEARHRYKELMGDQQLQLVLDRIRKTTKS